MGGADSLVEQQQGGLDRDGRDHEDNHQVQIVPARVLLGKGSSGVEESVFQ